MNAPIRSLLLDRPQVDIATIRKYGTSAFLLGNPDPFRVTQSGLRQNYLESTGVTPASASTETVGLHLDASQGAAIGAELLVSGDGQDTSGWTAQSAAALSATGGRFRVTGGASSFPSGVQSIATVVGSFYRIRRTRFGGTVDYQVRLGSTLNGTEYENTSYTSGQTGTDTTYIRATSTSLSYRVGLQSASPSGLYAEFDDLSVQLVSGNHFYQATSADEPTLTLTGGVWSYVGDGTSKHFRTGLVPAASCTVIVACKFNALLDRALGASVGTNFCSVGTPSGGKAALYAGSTVAAISADVITGIPGILAMRVSGSGYSGLWKSVSGAAEWVSGTFSGSIPTTQGFYLGTENDDGSSSLPLDGTVWRALAQQSAYTDGEIAAIANQWSRELVGVS